jgi:hypothetical protein
MPEHLLRQAFDPLMVSSVFHWDRPVLELAWNYVDLVVPTLLSFERPPLGWSLAWWA